MGYKYSVSEENKKVVCISSFAKRPVRGIAKCYAEHDVFDVETGKKLARLRCDVKVSTKRKQKALEKYNEALKMLAVAEERVAKMKNYVSDSTVELENAEAELAAFENTLR